MNQLPNHKSSVGDVVFFRVMAALVHMVTRPLLTALTVKCRIIKYIAEKRVAVGEKLAAQFF